MNARKYLVLLGVAVLSSLGDSSLSHGMHGRSISLDNLGQLIAVVFTPWVGLGILLLLGFMVAYMNALSWADLTYVLPATAVGNIVLAFIAKFALHEKISTARWIGIVLITIGVGFVARGPSKTVAPREDIGYRPQTAGGQQP